MSPPEGYRKLPDGIRCRCINLWKEAPDVYWCCNIKSPDTGADEQLKRRAVLRAAEAGDGTITDPGKLADYIQDWLDHYRDVDHTPNFNFCYLKNDELKAPEWELIISSLRGSFTSGDH